jgi:hypothetical protein
MLGREPWVAEGETDCEGGETLDAGGNHGLQKVRQLVQEVRHWMLEEPWVAEDETDGAGGETLDAGGTMGCRR